jgi:urea transporter
VRLHHPHVDPTTFALEAGIILGPVIGLLIAALLHARGHGAEWALVAGLWGGLLVAAVIAIPTERHRR